MSAYIEPIKTAMLIFPFLALAISGIFFVYEYRKYGRFLFFRGLIIYSFVFYLLCAYFLVILPLPPIEKVAQLTTPRYELNLFASLQRFLEHTVLQIGDPSTYLPALKQSVFLEPMFNVLITIPFGIYLRYFFGLNWKKTLLSSFCLSLFFELTQLSGLFFIYPRPYRLFDVNDLLNNSLGGLVGWLIAPVFTFLLPSRQKLDKVAYAKGQEVTFFRRLAAFVLDWIVIGVVIFAAAILSRLVGQDELLAFINTSFWDLLMIFLYFILLDYLLKGQTLGKKIVRIKVMEEGRDRVSFKALLIRYGLLYFVYGGIGQLTTKLAPLISSQDHLLAAVAVILSVGGFLLQVLFFIHIIWSVLRKRRRLFYEHLSNTYVISTITVKEP